MMTIDSLTQSAIELLKNLIQTPSFSSEEEVLDEEFSQAQKSFARDNRIFIDPAAHPLQEKIDNL